MSMIGKFRKISIAHLAGGLDDVPVKVQAVRIEQAEPGR